MFRFLWPVIIFVLLGTSACRVEIGLGSVAAQNPVSVTSLASLSSTPTMLPTLLVTNTTHTEAISTPAPPTEVSSQIVITSTPEPTQSTVEIASLSNLNESDEVSYTLTPQSILPAQVPPDRIIIPTVALDTPVEAIGWDVVKQGATEISVWDVPENAAGWHQNSALPGHGGNIVLSGHHNLGAEVFRNLVNLKKGDEIILQADGRDYRYEVTDHFILPERGVSEEQRQQNVQWIMSTTDERLTLVTCWPYNDNSHRLIVVAQ